MRSQQRQQEAAGPEKTPSKPKDERTTQPQPQKTQRENAGKEKPYKARLLFLRPTARCKSTPQCVHRAGRAVSLRGCHAGLSIFHFDVLWSLSLLSPWRTNGPGTQHAGTRQSSARLVHPRRRARHHLQVTTLLLPHIHPSIHAPTHPPTRIRTNKQPTYVRITVYSSFYPTTTATANIPRRHDETSPKV